MLRKSQPVMGSNMFRCMHCIHAAVVLALYVAQLATNIELFLVILQFTSLAVMCVLLYVNAKCLFVFDRAASDLRCIFLTERLRMFQRTCRLGIITSVVCTCLLTAYITLELIHVFATSSLNQTQRETTRDHEPVRLVHESITITVSAFSWALVFAAAVRLAKSTVTVTTRTTTHEVINVHPNAEKIMIPPSPKRHAFTVPPSPRRHAFTDGRATSQVNTPRLIQCHTLQEAYTEAYPQASPQENQQADDLE